MPDVKFKSYLIFPNDTAKLNNGLVLYLIASSIAWKLLFVQDLKRLWQINSRIGCCFSLLKQSKLSQQRSIFHSVDSEEKEIERRNANFELGEYKLYFFSAVVPWNPILLKKKQNFNQLQYTLDTCEIMLVIWVVLFVLGIDNKIRTSVFVYKQTSLFLIPSPAIALRSKVKFFNEFERYFKNFPSL